MKRSIAPVLFAVALLLGAELSFRIYLYGPGAINPLRMDSYTQIHDSGLVQAAGVTPIRYELKANLDSWYKGARFRTNSVGLRDTEHPYKKNPDVTRVAVLGASWTMGSGIDAGDIWHAQLAEQFNASGTPQRYEFINFGVDQYGLGEIVATLEHKVPAYEPDLIIIGLTYFTPTLLWTEPAEPYTAQNKRHPFFDSHVLRVIDYRLGTGLFYTPFVRPELAWDEKGRVAEQLERAFKRISTYAEQTDTPVVITKLAYQRGWGKKKDLIATQHRPYAPNLAYIDLTESVLTQGYSPEELRVSVWDSHPNALGHRLLADAFYEGYLAGCIQYEARVSGDQTQCRQPSSPDEPTKAASRASKK